MHAENALSAVLSRRHSNRAPASLAANVNVADVAVVGLAGPEVIVVFGGVVSTIVQLHDAEPTLPAASVARTWKVCGPRASAG